MSQKHQKCSLDFYHSTSSVKGKPGHHLTLWGDGPILSEGLESLSIYALKHHFKLLPPSVAVISFFGINVKGLQVVNDPSIEDFPVLGLVGVEIELRGLPSGY